MDYFSDHPACEKRTLSQRSTSSRRSAQWAILSLDSQCVVRCAGTADLVERKMIADRLSELVRLFLFKRA